MFWAAPAVTTAKVALLVPLGMVMVPTDDSTGVGATEASLDAGGGGGRRLPVDGTAVG